MVSYVPPFHPFQMSTTKPTTTSRVYSVIFEQKENIKQYLKHTAILEVQHVCLAFYLIKQKHFLAHQFLTKT